MNQKDVWGKYILAQEMVLENKSKPILVNTALPVKLEGNKILVSVDQEIYKKVFKIVDFTFCFIIYFKNNLKNNNLKKVKKLILIFI